LSGQGGTGGKRMWVRWKLGTRRRFKNGGTLYNAKTKGRVVKNKSLNQGNIRPRF